MVSLHTTWCLSLISAFLLLADHAAAVVVTDQYTFGPLIGEGSFGAVFRATPKDGGSERWSSVVKQVQLNKTDAHRRQTNSEAVWGSRARRQGYAEHGNLCLVDHTFASTTGQADFAHLIMREVQKGTTEEYRRIGLDVPNPDLLANAELYQLIRRNLPKPDDKTPNNNNRLVTRKNLSGPCAGDIQCVIARIAMQTLCGIAALHEIDSEEQSGKITIVHQDIKPTNILLGKFGSQSSLAGVDEEYLSAKIIDLGSARVSGKDRSTGGSAAYVAPETILAFYDGMAEYDSEYDSFAAGLTLMELATGKAIADADEHDIVYDGWMLLEDDSYRSKKLAQNDWKNKNPFLPELQKRMDLWVLGQDTGIGLMDPGRDEFFQEVRAEYKASKGSPEKYKQTFVHFMLGGEEASDIGSRRTLVKLVRMGGLLNGDRIGRAKASDAVNHPWLRNHAKGLVCDLKTKRGTMTPQQYTPFLARGLLRSAYDSAASTTSHNGATRTLLRSTYAAAVPAPPAPDPPQKQEQKKGAVVASCFGECAVQ